MTQPTPGDVHLSVPLTNISIAFVQDQMNFVATRVFPNIPVQKQTDKYWTFPRSFFNRDQMRKRAPGTQAPRIGYVPSNDNYLCDIWDLGHPIPDETRANADMVIAPDRRAVQLLTTQGLIRRENEFVGKYFQAGVWTFEVSGAAARSVSDLLVASGDTVVYWNDASSTPIEDVRLFKTTMMERTGFEPNTFTIGQHVLDALVDHPDIIDRVKYGQTSGGPAEVDVPELQALFKIPRILVMKSVQNTSEEVQGDNDTAAINAQHSFIGGGKSAMLSYVPPAPGMEVPSAGYTFSWTGFLGAGPDGQRIRQYRDEPVHSDIVEIDMAFDLKVVSQELGMFLDGIVQ